MTGSATPAPPDSGETDRQQEARRIAMDLLTALHRSTDERPRRKLRAFWRGFTRWGQP